MKKFLCLAESVYLRATDWMAEVRVPIRTKIIVLSIAFTSALAPMQSPIQWAKGALSR
jgi:hypothetical protein